MKTTTRFHDAGFALVELTVTVGIVGVLMVGATVVMPSMLTGSRADSSTALVLNSLRLARDRAIGERRNMDLVLTTPNHFQIRREGISGEANAIVSDTYLGNGQEFTAFTGLSDTPDLFGLTNKPIAFGPTAGSPAAVMFTSEGTLVDSSGDTINGTIFLGIPGRKDSARAITIFGPTALLRVWRWDGMKWTE